MSKLALETGMKMLPPWLAMPELPQGMGWRMGVGETYKLDFADWFRNLPKDERVSYADQYTEPEDWKGFFYDIVSSQSPSEKD